jgi:hypothetical protein
MQAEEPGGAGGDRGGTGGRRERDGPKQADAGARAEAAGARRGGGQLLHRQRREGAPRLVRVAVNALDPSALSLWPPPPATEWYTPAA